MTATVLRFVVRLSDIAYIYTDTPEWNVTEGFLVMLDVPDFFIEGLYLSCRNTELTVHPHIVLSCAVPFRGGVEFHRNDLYTIPGRNADSIEETLPTYYSSFTET